MTREWRSSVNGTFVCHLCRYFNIPVLLYVQRLFFFPLSFTSHFSPLGDFQNKCNIYSFCSNDSLSYSSPHSLPLLAGANGTIVLSSMCGLPQVILCEIELWLFFLLRISTDLKLKRALIMVCTPWTELCFSSFSSFIWSLAGLQWRSGRNLMFRRDRKSNRLGVHPTEHCSLRLFRALATHEWL